MPDPSPVERLLWVDLEMSGLDPEACRILEVAAIVTDLEFSELETLHEVVHQPPEVLSAMDAWCTQHHAESGLTAAVAEGRPEAEVEQAVRALIDRHFPPNRRAVLCGNSVGTDREFIRAWWPSVARRLHYRLVDVSSWKVILKERFKVTVKKAGGHRALDDVRESIRELETYVGLLDPERLPAR